MRAFRDSLHAISLACLLALGCGDSKKSAPEAVDAGALDAGPEGDAEVAQVCVHEGKKAPDFLKKLGCEQDYKKLASNPVDASIPGARSVKTVIDRSDGNALYFQNSVAYPIHFDFASSHLSGEGKPIVSDLRSFNATEYFSGERRFILGAVTYYEAIGKFAYEISPYDSATAEMIEQAYTAIAAATYFGDALYFHPTSEMVSAEAEKLSDKVKIITTDELFAGIDYQPLNLAESYGFLRYATIDDLEEGKVSFRDIVVLESVPYDISVVMGIITAEFQTPLSHVNVLSRNRGTPNMGLRNAQDNKRIKPLLGKWVRLKVGAFDYEIEEVTAKQADAWWEKHKPKKVQVPRIDLTVKDLRDAEKITDPKAPIREAVKAAIPAFGGKASHYSVLTHIKGLPVSDAFAVPVFYYDQFMKENGFDVRVRALLDDPTFTSDSPKRLEALLALQADMEAAPVNAEFTALLHAKCEAKFPGQRLRFRSSTNAEDLEGFTGAGLYTSKSGDPKDPDKPILKAVREVWASVWNFRAFEERTYRGIDHEAVAIALLVHRSFPDEEANGVALTNNPFDESNVEPAFYVNVQRGGESVVQPEQGVFTDQYLHYFDQRGKPVVYIARTSLPPEGKPVLSNAQINELGEALDLIRTSFYPAYGATAGGTGWWAMDVEFKFDQNPDTGKTQLFVKQARPYGNISEAP